MLRVLGGAIGLVLLLLGVHLPVAAYHADGTATEAVMLRDSGWCPSTGCLGLTEWGRLVADGAVRGALIITYANVEQWRPLAVRAAKRGVIVAVAALPAEIGGEYDPITNRITISAALLDEPSSVVGAIVAHETYHAAAAPVSLFTLLSRQDPGYCFRSEQAAMSWTAAAWVRLRRGDERTAWSRDLDALAQAWAQQRLGQWVLESRGYQASCLGRPLPSF